MAEKNQKQVKNLVFVSVLQASNILGISEKTIRRAIQRNEIKYFIKNERYKIIFPYLIKWALSKTTIKNKLEKKGIGQWVEKWKI